MRVTAIALALTLLVSGPAVAQNQPSLSNYNVVLVPVFFFGAGAHGSQWETSVTIASTATHSDSMPVPLLEEPFASACGDPDGEIEPEMIRAICRGYASPSGLLLYIPKSLDLRDLHFNARIRDLSRDATSAGTEIPVVNESEFRSGDILLVDIPSDARFRANLRIYAGVQAFTPDFRFIHPGGTVSVEIYDSRELRVPLASAVMELTAPQVIEGSPYLTHPGSASIGDLVAAFPQLASVPNYTIRVRAHQTLADPPRELDAWAFVTITNNDTQQVTTISP